MPPVPHTCTVISSSKRSTARAIARPSARQRRPRRRHQAFDEIETQRPDPAPRQGLQGLVIDIGTHRGDSPGAPARGIQRVEQGSIVGSVATGLNDHVAGKAEMIVQRNVLDGVADRPAVALARVL